MITFLVVIVVTFVSDDGREDGVGLVLFFK